MRFIEKNISGVFEIQPEVYEDSRGFFFESFNQKVFREKIGEEVSFCQDNHSFSKKGVLRGIHYQKKPFEQGKLVRVADGRIFDVAIDLRKDSTSFGKWTRTNEDISRSMNSFDFQANFLLRPGQDVSRNVGSLSVSGFLKSRTGR